MATLPQDRLVRKEVALGTLRDLQPPTKHIGLTIAPFLDVQSDDVIFQYLNPDTAGMVPARAEDAESELAQHDDTFGEGRASLIDWAEKSHYRPSDVSRYREYTRLAELAGGNRGAFPLTVGSMTEDFPSKVARDTVRRSRKLYNRLEWLIMTGLQDGVIAYNDGKVKFTVDYQRPANQSNEDPASGIFWDAGVTHDPIGDLQAVQEIMDGLYQGIRIDRGIISKKAARQIINSDRFAARTGLTPVYNGTDIVQPDPQYVLSGWDYTAAMQVVEQATGIKLQVYDSVYPTRAIGATTPVYNRFTDEKQIILLPSAEDMAEIDDSDIGFAKTLTSPHPEGNWTSGFYEWEKDTGPDPWGHDVGSGIKAFPVFPHLQYTYTLKVLA